MSKKHINVANIEQYFLSANSFAVFYFLFVRITRISGNHPGRSRGRPREARGRPQEVRGRPQEVRGRPREARGRP